jgi:hypothetical protein
MNTLATKTQTAQVKCINKRDRPNPHERITHIGGYANSQWKLTQEDAIGKIERGEWKFYVALPGANRTVWVEVGVSRFGNKYLRTEGDDDNRNNLLSLPECP